MTLKYEIYADEAWTHNTPPLNRYHYFFGGIFGKENDLDKLHSDLSKILINHGVRGEVKWSKTNEKNIDCYKELVDCLKKHILIGNIKYRQMFKDRSYHYDNKEGVSELDIQFKLYYQFLKNSFGLKYLPRLSNGEKYNILIRLDNHSSQKHKDSLNRFVLSLPSTLWMRNDVTIQVTYINSAKFLRLQICDLLMGAAGYYGNKFHLKREVKKRGMTKKQKIKYDLSKYIYNSLREIDAKTRGTKAFNWFESTRLARNPENLYLHHLRIWKFIPSIYRKNKGWENDNLTADGCFIRDNFEVIEMQGIEETESE